jgi:hypothetical protein
MSLDPTSDPLLANSVYVSLSQDETERLQRELSETTASLERRALTAEAAAAAQHEVADSATMLRERDLAAAHRTHADELERHREAAHRQLSDAQQVGSSARARVCSCGGAAV